MRMFNDDEKLKDLQQELSEEYEDSLFRLAAFYALELEGKLLQQEMEQIPLEERIYPSEQQMARFKREIDKRMSRAKWSRRRQRIMPLLSAAAVMVLVVAIVFSGLVMNVEAVRHRVFNLFLTKETEYTLFELKEASPEGAGAGVKGPSGYLPSYVPEGYLLVEREVNSRNARTVYMKGEDHYIVLTEISPDGRLYLDTENVDREEMIWLNDDEYEALLIEKYGYVSLTWHAHGRIFTLKTDVSLEESIKIAESVSYED